MISGVFSGFFPEVSPFLNLTVKRRECMRLVLNLLVPMKPIGGGVNPACDPQGERGATSLEPWCRKTEEKQVDMEAHLLAYLCRN